VSLRGDSDAELVRLAAGELAWNRLPGPFFFHYTDRTAARAIVATRAYDIGSRHPKTPGLYVTSYQPGQLTCEELLNAIFDGTRDIERTRAAVVMAADPLPFKRVTPSAWRHAAPVGTRLDLTEQLFGWAAIEEEEWCYSPSLYVS
jgi:hypothetical protein